MAANIFVIEDDEVIREELMHLFQNTGRIISRIDLIEFLCDNQIHIDDNALSVHMTRLRQKLNEIGVEDLIRTKRGLGYKI